MEDIKNFFIKLGFQEQILEYIENNSIILPGSNNEFNSFYGCFPIIENGIFQKIRICIPNPIDIKAKLIIVHECAHALQIIPFINKEYPILEDESYPYAIERLYIMSFNSKSLLNWFNDYQKNNSVNNKLIYKEAYQKQFSLIKKIKKNYHK